MAKYELSPANTSNSRSSRVSAGLRRNVDFLPVEEEAKLLAAQFCTWDYISKTGRDRCEDACQSAQCCYKDHMDCSPICEDYVPCTILGITAEITKKQKVKSKKDIKNKNR